MILSKNEEKILELLKKKKNAEIEELEKEVEINRDGIKRSIYFLHSKGLVKMKSRTEKKFIITEKGKNALERGFEEEKVDEYKGKYVKELPGEIKKMFWLLRETGKIEIIDGKLKVNDGKYILRSILEDINSGKDIEKYNKRYVDALKKEGYIKEEKSERISAEITEEGLEYESEEKGEINLLSREVIINKEWKSKRFKQFNISYEGEPEDIGKLHALTMAIKKIKKVFLSLGFREMTGNYVESSFWVFDALFQPQDHPSRELADTFYIKGESDEKIDEKLKEEVKKMHESKWKYKWSGKEAKRLVLRTHTTALSSRTLFENKSGKYFAIGRVFRNEAVDYKHLAEFHQIEGIVAWKKANFRNLLWLLKEFYSRLGFKKIRFRPSYFPYTEPSLEIETYFEGRKEWIEIGGAGIFRREVVEPLGAEYPVLAWGLSLERPLMLMLGIEDIRTFYTNKKRWLDSVSYKKIF